MVVGPASQAQNEGSETSSKFQTYYVDPSGNDDNSGRGNQPFLTINRAAEAAMPGDTIEVRTGIYREWVNPPRGGTSDYRRIVYRAASGADVRILGSETARGWEQQENGTWRLELDTAQLGKKNPFNTLVRHPVPVDVDESGDGWGWLKYGRWTHLGDIILNGEGLTEQPSLETVPGKELTWFTRQEGSITVLYANFGTSDPNLGNVELSFRPHAIFPENPGINYITINGFTIMNVACHWAPPTVFQPGAMGPNGGHHWIIENNIILYAKAAAISIGLPSRGYRSHIKGHHTIRNNVIMRCGQGGTTGQEWNTHSVIQANHIEQINYREEFGGWETAAIKHHGGDSLVIKRNFIRGVYTLDPSEGAAHGIWNDYANSNWNVSGNIILDTEAHVILAEANWEGPNLYANNILINGTIGTYSSRGDAWVHNLFVNCTHQWENQPWGGRPQIGNSRWLNNIFSGGGLNPKIIEDKSFYRGNAFLDGARETPEDKSLITAEAPFNGTLEEKDSSLYMTFYLDRTILDNPQPVVTKKSLKLPFSMETGTERDFFGKQREDETVAGPFAGPEEGSNRICIYTYPASYYKALEITTGK